MAKADFLKQKAESFFEIGKNRLEIGDFAIAAFNYEQAAQLYLKYYFLKRLGDFPKVHSLTELLKELGRAYEKNSDFEKFEKENASVIGDLNQSYITSRYLPVEFNKYQVENMEKFVESLIQFLEKICQ